MEHQGLVDQLSALSIREFGEVVQAACERRWERKELKGGDFEIDTMSLAESSYGQFQGERDKGPYTCLCAVPHPDVAHVQWTTLSQSGVCDYCGPSVTSVGKLAVCPVCHHRVECT